MKIDITLYGPKVSNFQFGMPVKIDITLYGPKVSNLVWNACED